MSEKPTMERCPGTGAFARDLAGNPGANCPVCGKYCRFTKSGGIRLHKRPKQSELDRLQHELERAQLDEARALGDYNLAGSRLRDAQDIQDSLRLQIKALKR